MISDLPPLSGANEPRRLERPHQMGLWCWCLPAWIFDRGWSLTLHRKLNGTLPTAEVLREMRWQWENAADDDEED